MTAPIPREVLQDGERVLWTGGCVAQLDVQERIGCAIGVVFGALLGVAGISVVAEVWFAEASFSSNPPNAFDLALGLVVGLGFVAGGASLVIACLADLRASVRRQRNTVFAVTDRAALVVVSGPGGGVTRHPVGVNTRIDLDLGSRPFLHMATVTKVEEGKDVHTRVGFEAVADPTGAYAHLLAVREAHAAKPDSQDARQGPCTVAGGRLPGQ